MAEKIKRDAFLYLAPARGGDEFAQCETCHLYNGGKKLCSLMGDTKVLPSDSCGFYVPGEPSDDIEVFALVSPAEAGLVHREVRCENCEYFKSDKGRCGLYEM